MSVWPEKLVVTANGGRRPEWERLMREAGGGVGSKPIKVTGSAHVSADRMLQRKAQLEARTQLHRDKVQGVRSPDSMYIAAGLPLPEREKTFWEKWRERRGGS